MISSKALFDNLTSQLSAHYASSEAQSIVFLLLHHYCQATRTDILLNKSLDDHIDWPSIMVRLQQHEPVQYVIGESDFYGRKFVVNSSVLIPRPETEELVQWVISTVKRWNKSTTQPIKLLDIGTGSGCIAITLAKELPQAQVWAWDISAEALAVARQNAEHHQVNVFFEQIDVLTYNPAFAPSDESFLAIVSNPPYVTNSESAQIQPNVLLHEPHLALFVADDDPLIFYKKIAQIAEHQLVEGGGCFMEINEQFGSETKQLFEREPFQSAQLLQDIHGKERFVGAFKSHLPTVSTI